MSGCDYDDDRPTDADKAGSCPRCGRPAVSLSDRTAVCGLDHPWSAKPKHSLSRMGRSGHFHTPPAGGSDAE